MEVYYLIFILSVFWHGTDGIMWSLAPNTQKCLKEELHANVLVAGEYEVTEVVGQRVDYIVSYKLHFWYSRLYLYLRSSTSLYALKTRLQTVVLNFIVYRRLSVTTAIA